MMSANGIQAAGPGPDATTPVQPATHEVEGSEVVK